MENIKNIHPIYFNSFVGIWKRAASNGTITNDYMKFNKDCTYESNGTSGPLEDLVNGDVDEISVDGDGHGNDGFAIKGKAVLIKDSEPQVWKYILAQGGAPGFKNRGTRLEFRMDKQRVIYVGNLPLSEEGTKKSGKKKTKV